MIEKNPLKININRNLSCVKVLGLGFTGLNIWECFARGEGIKERLNGTGRSLARLWERVKQLKDRVKPGTLDNTLKRHAHKAIAVGAAV